MSPTLVYAVTFSTTAGSLAPQHEAKARAEAQKMKALNFKVIEFSYTRKVKII
jgi:hypothetical protein